MNDQDNLRRTAFIGVALALVVGVVTVPLYFAAFGWDIEAAIFVQPDAVLGQGAEVAPLWRWGFLGDMLWSYLLLTPLALFAHRRLRERGPWLADLGLTGALAYIFIGGGAAAVLAIAGSSLIEAHAAAAPTDQAAIVASFHLLRDGLVFGVWQTLDPITAGTWLVGAGWLLREERSRFGRLLVVLGFGLWVLALMTMLGIHSLAVLGAIFGAALVIWLGWTLIEQSGVRPGQPDGDSTSGDPR